MKSSDFLELATKHASNTDRVRVCAKNWGSSGVSRINDGVTSNIGKIIAFLEDKAKMFCKENEFLMIYNFQSLDKVETDNSEDDPYWCSLYLLIRSKSKITDLNSCEGRPLQLGIDGKSGQVVSNAYILQEMGIEDEGVDETYGNFLDYSDPKPKPSSDLQNVSTKCTTVVSQNAVLFSASGTALSEEKRRAETSVTQLNSQVKTKSDNNAITFAYNLNTNHSFRDDASISDVMISPSAMLSPFDSEDVSSKVIAQMAIYVNCFA